MLPNVLPLAPFTHTLFTGKLPFRDHVLTGPFLKKIQVNQFWHTKCEQRIGLPVLARTSSECADVRILGPVIMLCQSCLR